MKLRYRRASVRAISAVLVVWLNICVPGVAVKGQQPAAPPRGRLPLRLASIQTLRGQLFGIPPLEEPAFAAKPKKNSRTTLSYPAVEPDDLMIHAEKGDLKAFGRLLRRKPVILDENGVGPHHLAALHGHTEILQVVVRQVKFALRHDSQTGRQRKLEGFNVPFELADDNGWNVLAYAIRGGYPKTVRYCLDHFVRSCETESGKNSLHLCAEHGATPTANEVLDVVVQQIRKRQGDGGLAKKLSEEDANGMRPIDLAIVHGRKSMVPSLLMMGGHQFVPTTGRQRRVPSPLHLASLQGSPDMMQLLVESGCHVDTFDAQDHCPLHYACGRNRPQAVKFLLEHKASLTFGEWKPIHFALAGGNVRIVEALEKHGVNLLAPDGLGYTPLHYAIALGNKKLVNAILARGAQVNEVSLSTAERAGHTEITKILLSKLRGRK